MLTVKASIHGWSPAGDDDMEVNVSQDMYLMSINPISSSSALLSPLCPPLNTILPNACASEPQPTTCSPPLTETPHAIIAPSSDRRAQRNRNRDPGWIPRPRNAFIIFRCEYSREHAQGIQDPSADHDASSASVKTLSKRAAEAWKELPLSERERYKVLADKEREEHARLYPHYRFRPMKRQSSSGTRKSSRERSQSPKETSPTESRPKSSTCFPSVLAAAPQKGRRCSYPSLEVAAPMPHTAAAPTPIPRPLSESYLIHQEIQNLLDPLSHSYLTYPNLEI